MSEARGVIWDMDGVIVNSARQHFQAWREAFARKGVDFTDEMFRRYFGQKNERIIRSVLGSKIKRNEIEDFSLRKEERFRELARQNLRPLDGVVKLVKSLHEQGFKMAIASSAPMENIRLTTQALGITECFDAFVSAEEVSEGKPHPEVFLLAAKKLGLKPENCVVVEDAIAGVAACKASGASCLAVTNTNSAKELRDADMIVDSLEQVRAADFNKLIDVRQERKMEKTLVLIKPDAMERNLAATILSRLEAKGLRLVALKMLHVDRKLAEKHYGIHREKPFFKDLVDYITSTPIVAAVFAGEDAVARARQIMGATNPDKADKGTIRAEFGVDIQRNSVHGSDAPQTAEQEIKLFFSPAEIFE